ncbi:MAG: CBS domain-containing protein [Magnetococcales bacterium]|nr:CBS domain-containing protein [Magnetococcales bacterium]
MEIPDKLVTDVRPFFLNFLGKLATDLNTLTAAPVTINLTSVELLRGEKDLGTLLEKDRCVAFANEDGLDTGNVHLIIDVATSIALTGLMMMMGEDVIQNQVETREYNEEIQEGFNEVANQIVGVFNGLVEENMKDGGHLFLESAERFEPGGEISTLEPERTYLTIVADMQVASFPVEECRILLSKGFGDPLLNVNIPGTPAEEAEMAERNKGQVEEESSEEVADDFSEALGAEGDEAGDELAADDTGLNLGDDTAKYDTSDGLPVPDEPGGLKVVMTEKPFSLREDEHVMTAINAMRHDGNRYIGVTDKDKKLIRVVSKSDLRQIMGPFFGTKAMGARDKAVCTLGIGKLNEDQQLIRIPQTGSINQAADLLLEFNLRSLPVINGQGILQGFITMHSVMSYFRKKKNM